MAAGNGRSYHERQDGYAGPQTNDKNYDITNSKPHHSVGFWHPHLGKVRKHVILLWIRTGKLRNKDQIYGVILELTHYIPVLILLVAIISILSLYWGVLFKVDQNLRSLIIYVVDFDAQVAPYNNVEPIVGPAVTQMTDQLMNSPSPSLGYTTVSASQFDNDPLQVREAVYTWDCWAAIIINPNATSLLQAAVETGNSSYDPTGAVQIVIQTARDSTTFQSNISPYLDKFIEEFGASFGPMWSQMIMSNDTYTRANLASASAAVNPGVAPLLYDLRPFQPAVATPAVSIGLIYLIIMAFFSFSFFLPIHMVSLLNPHVPRHSHQAKSSPRNTSSLKATPRCTSGSSSSGAGSPPWQPTP